MEHYTSAIVRNQRFRRSANPVLPLYGLGIHWQTALRDFGYFVLFGSLVFAFGNRMCSNATADVATASRQVQPVRSPLATARPQPGRIDIASQPMVAAA